MEITLSRDLEEWIHEQVASGQYQTPSDVVEAMVRQVRLAELREKLRVGVGQLDRGEKTPLTKELMKDIQRRGRDRRNTRRKARQRPR